MWLIQILGLFNGVCRLFTLFLLLVGILKSQPKQVFWAYICYILVMISECLIVGLNAPTALGLISGLICFHAYSDGANGSFAGIRMDGPLIGLIVSVGIKDILPKIFNREHGTFNNYAGLHYFA